MPYLQIGGKMAQSKKFQDLDLNNAFLFAAALEEPETCRLVLELILEKPVKAVNVRAERTILFNSDFRSVRLDIFATDELAVDYNLEMQNEDEGNLPKRSRYHQAEIDVASLKPGEDFNDLKPSIIVFICTFDPFGKNAYRYTFEQRCTEYDFSLGDETKRIFLNTKGKNDNEVSEELKCFLKYVENSTDSYVEQVENSKIHQLHERIKGLKRSRKLEERYMHFEELLERELKKGLEKGIKQGIEQGIQQGIEQGVKKGQVMERERLLALISCMASNGESELISKLSEDEELYEKMLEKYNL